MTEEYRATELVKCYECGLLYAKEIYAETVDQDYEISYCKSCEYEMKYANQPAVPSWVDLSRLGKSYKREKLE